MPKTWLSLGTITSGTATAGPYRITRATTTGAKGGTLRPTYDAAGNVTALYVSKANTCRPAGIGCSPMYLYEWDELGRLSHARRWDNALLNVDLPPIPLVLPAADLRFRYDADDNRVLKTSVDPLLQTRHTAYIFGSLELRRAQYPVGGDYERTDMTEVPYLLANGVRLARVVYDPNIPVSGAPAQHVFFELGDHLGSTSTVMDQATGELVEKGTYQPYGNADSDYRPDRWKFFREDYRFTGKEEDVEVGLTYFGKRFYNAELGRWMSPDPLAVHDAGSADLNLYAYVHGQALKGTDPIGLEGPVEESKEEEEAETAEFEPPETEVEETTLTPEEAAEADVVEARINGEPEPGPSPKSMGGTKGFMCSTRPPTFQAMEPARSTSSPEPVRDDGSEDAAAIRNELAKAQAPTDPAARRRVPDDAFVVRGGVATPEQIERGISEHRGVPGLIGFSAQSRPGASVKELAATGHKDGGPFPHGQVSVTTAGQLRCIGCDVIPSPGGGANHVTVTPGPATPVEISLHFFPQPNPARPR